ncbi:response regulator transcription factor [Flavisolibacter sp. BT320]|nr:response regulator transcription factor [Flavisolibacter longurius]
MISVCFIEDNLSDKDALITFLKQAEDITVLNSGNSLTDLSAVIKWKPGVVVFNSQRGNESNIECLYRLKEALPDTQVIIRTDLEEDKYIFSSLKAGVIGYLLRTDPHQTILEAIRKVYKGEGVINGQIARKILAYFQQPIKNLSNLDRYHLTNREREVLLHLMAGLSYKEIATRCFVSIDTVNSHIRKIYSKLNVRSRAEIAARFR